MKKIFTEKRQGELSIKMNSKLTSTTALVLVLSLTCVQGIGKCFLKDTCEATRHKNIASKTFVKKIPCVQLYAPTQLRSGNFELYQKLCPNLAKGMTIRRFIVERYSKFASQTVTLMDRLKCCNLKR